jgi:dTDP-L-rhamnose 4-epimerase
VSGATPRKRLDADAHVLITGGAGFIGSHLANTLVEAGCRVRVLDSMAQQVHGTNAQPPSHLNTAVEVRVGDVRDREAVDQALAGITHVYHFAAAVGVGQSMYQIDHYTDVNNRGTAVLLEALAARPVQRLVVASSMSVYGEGLYQRNGEIHEPPLRSREQLSRGEWEVRDAAGVLMPLATPESKRSLPASVYALSKYDQEQLCLICGDAYRIPTVALRFFNVYGTHQSLSNPYTGVLAIFASRCLNGNPPQLFEDGKQQRDFVSVEDIAQACRLAMTTDAVGEVFNIGSGEPRSILTIAHDVIAALDVDLEPVITGKYRVGDIRHCFADIGKARELLGYEPRVRFDAGLRSLAEWLASRQATDHFVRATNELERRGLTL